ncbi:hypothetical protein [Rugosimonospora africana]|nr:hypothetical protein [Rugosimonospora africana]
MSDVEARLARIRGTAPVREHTARTIAALTTNPGCDRRAVLDAAGIDKQKLAGYVEFPVPSGQSPFAISRGNAFEAQVKADGCAGLLRLLGERLGLPVPEVSYADLAPAGTGASLDARHARTRELLAEAAAAGPDGGVLLDHPLLRLDVGGRAAYLEPDLIAVRLRGRFHVVEIKSFAVIDGQADGRKVAAAATQAAVYVLALRGLLAELGYGPETVADEVVLICPENFANQPTAALVDVRRQLTVLTRQLSRLARIGDLIATLPADLTFDLGAAGAQPEPGCGGGEHPPRFSDDSAVPGRPVVEVVGALHATRARYAPECLDACELAYFCRDEARGQTAALGRSVHDELGGVPDVAGVLDLAAGTRVPDPDQAEAAELLRLAARLRAESLASAL